MALKEVENAARRTRRWTSLLFRNELPVLLGILVVLAGIWSFVEIADEVVEGETHAVDEALLLALRNPEDHTDPLGPGWMEELGRDLTALGGMGVLVLFALGAVGYLLLGRHLRAAVFTAIAVPGGMVLSLMMKFGFDRPRPELVPHGSIVYTSSFPSGHAMMAAVVYLTLAALLARVQPDPRMKAYVLGVAVLFTVLAGVSRVYLGVHWPTDVLAGWAAGAAWAVFCWLMMRWLQARYPVSMEH